MNENEQSKKPTHGAYMIREREGAEGFWTRIGIAWPHKDGNGFNVLLDAVPFDRQITLRVLTEKS